MGQGLCVACQHPVLRLLELDILFSQAGTYETTRILYYLWDVLPGPLADWIERKGFEFSLWKRPAT